MPNYSGMHWDTTGPIGDVRYSQAQRRDSMGRYAGHNDLVSELYSVMGSATNDSERQGIQNLINNIQSNRVH